MLDARAKEGKGKKIRFKKLDKKSTDSAAKSNVYRQENDSQAMSHSMSRNVFAVKAIATSTG